MAMSRLKRLIEAHDRSMEYDRLMEERQQILFEMEQRAELAGGPVAEELGDRLEEINKELETLRQR